MAHQEVNSHQRARVSTCVGIFRFSRLTNVATDCSQTCGDFTVCSGVFGPLQVKSSIYNCSCQPGYLEFYFGQGGGCYAPCVSGVTDCGTQSSCQAVGGRRRGSQQRCTCNSGYASPTYDGKNCVPYCDTGYSQYFGIARDPGYFSTSEYNVIGPNNTGIDLSSTGFSQLSTCDIPTSATALFVAQLYICSFHIVLIMPTAMFPGIILTLLTTEIFLGSLICVICQDHTEIMEKMLNGFDSGICRRTTSAI